MITFLQGKLVEALPTQVIVDVNGVGYEVLIPLSSFDKLPQPGQPVMPGVLIIESMAQTGGVLLLMEIPDRERKLLYFAALDSARFRKPVVPGDQLMIHVDVLNNRGDFWKMHGEARVNGEVAAEANLMCKMIDRDAAAPAGAGKK